MNHPMPVKRCPKCGYDLDNPILKAIEQMGSQVALARKLRISPQAVGQWVAGLTRITAERAIEIERATGGAVTRAELRPDLFGPDPAEPKQEERAA